MDKKLTELVNSNEAINVLANAIIALPGGPEALDAAIAEMVEADAAAQHQVGSPTNKWLLFKFAQLEGMAKQAS